MGCDGVWFELGEGEGVLEFEGTDAGATLELHIVFDAETGRTIGWWENEHGAWLTAVDAGVA